MEVIMESTNLNLLKRRRKEIEAELQELIKNISDYENIQLEQKFEHEHQKLEKINQDYFNVFGDNYTLHRRLFTPISRLGYNGFTVGLTKRLEKLNLYYLWQVVTVTELEFKQSNMLGEHYTCKLKEEVEKMGLFLGMKLD